MTTSGLMSALKPQKPALRLPKTADRHAGQVGSNENIGHNNPVDDNFMVFRTLQIYKNKVV